MRAKLPRVKPGEYLVIMLTQTDGDIEIVSMSSTEIKEKVLSGKLHPTDFAVIDGVVIKSFDNKSVTHF